MASRLTKISHERHRRRPDDNVLRSLQSRVVEKLCAEHRQTTTAERRTRDARRIHTQLPLSGRHQSAANHSIAISRGHTALQSN